MVPEDLDGDFDFFPSRAVLDRSQSSGLPQKPPPGGPGKPESPQNTISPTRQPQTMNVASTPENYIVSPSMPALAPNCIRSLPRRRSHHPKVVHPSVSPIEPSLHPEVLDLIDTTHFERFPTSIPRRRVTRGRSPGYYGTFGGSEESSDESMGSGDEWIPSRA